MSICLCLKSEAVAQANDSVIICFRMIHTYANSPGIRPLTPFKSPIEFADTTRILSFFDEVVEQFVNAIGVTMDQTGHSEATLI